MAEIFESDSIEAGEQSSQTIIEGLKAYQIGAKIKRLRLRKGMGLAELGRHTSLSPAMLSKLENGRVQPTLPTLLRIAMVFAVGLEYFFNEPGSDRLAIVRKGERQDFVEEMASENPVYHFECLDYKAVERRSSAYLATFIQMPPESVPKHDHFGSEFIYVFTGSLGLLYNDQWTVLTEGDSAYFDSSFAHGYRQVGEEGCRAVVVTVP
jgi:transcriptional regulator with XRE-family HTH domain